MTSLIRRAVAVDTGRLPDSAYDTVLRETPARLAISPMFTTASV
jgi:hypothetical protein